MRPVVGAGRTALILAAAVLAAVVADGAPTGLATVDAVERALFAAVVVMAASSARPWALVCMAGVIALASPDGAGFVVAVLVLVAAGVMVWLRQTPPLLGSAIGAASSVLLLSLPAQGPAGATALAVVVAVTPVLISGWRQCDDRVWIWLRRAVVLGGVGVGALLAVFVVASYLGWRAGSRGAGESSAWLAAVKAGDQRGALAHLESANEAFDEASRLGEAVWTRPARVLPGLGRYLDVIVVVGRGGADLTRVTGTATKTASIDDLRPKGGRFDLEAIARARSPLVDVIATAADVQERTEAIDDTWLVPPVRDQLAEFVGRLVDAREEGDLALAAIDVAPELLGGRGERRYLVLFATPSESRELGGFLGNFGELVLSDGRISLARTGRTNVLNAGLTDAQLDALGGPGNTGPARRPEDAPDLDPARYPERYVRFDPGRFWQNITGTPDFPTVASAAADLYPQSGGSPIDGVLYVDPHALAALLRLTGPIAVEGMSEPLDGDNAADFLLRDQYLEFGNLGERVDLLERVARETFDRITRGDLPGPRTVADALGPMVERRHLMFWSVHPDAQGLLRRIAIDGSLPRPAPDLLAVTQANDNPGKADALLRRDVVYDAKFDEATGETTATVTITLHNDIPTGAELATLPDYVVGNLRLLPRGSNRTYLSVYTALGLEQMTVGGQPVPAESYQEYGVQRFGQFVVIPPASSVEVVLSLRGRLDLAEGYGLRVLSPPMVSPDALTVRWAPVGATEEQTHVLTSDRDGVLAVGRAR